MTIDRRGLLAAGLALTAADRAFAQPAEGPILTTASGRLRGISERGVQVFRGVPYGAPTDGENRYRPARPPVPWTGVRDAFTYGNTAPQLRLPGQVIPSISLSAFPKFPESEDCLVLNVWTPAMTGKRPVMLYAHGGGYTVNSGSSWLIDGANLARDEDVVVITLNHRLGPLGYADLGAVAQGFEGAGYVGQTDIVAALKWIRAHADRIGGDASRVMIFGESGGGAKVSVMMGMPAAKGLVHRAAVESGALVAAPPRAQSAAAAEAFIKACGLTLASAADMRRIPLDRLMAAAASLAPSGMARGFACVVDGKELPASPFAPKASPISANVPLIVGHNRHESSYLNADDEAQFHLDDPTMTSRVQKLFGEAKAGPVLAAYRASNPGATPTEIYLQITTDQRMGATSRQQAQRKAAAGGAPAYFYRFDWRTPVENGKWGAPHTLEIPFVFRNIDRPQIKVLVGDAPPQPLSHAMARAWATFARTGDPNHSGLPKWKPYGPDRSTMIFNTPSRAVDDPDSGQRQAMDAALGMT